MQWEDSVRAQISIDQFGIQRKVHLHEEACLGRGSCQDKDGSISQETVCLEKGHCHPLQQCFERLICASEFKETQASRERRRWGKQQKARATCQGSLSDGQKTPSCFYTVTRTRGINQKTNACFLKVTSSLKSSLIWTIQAQGKACISRERRAASF